MPAIVRLPRRSHRVRPLAVHSHGHLRTTIQTDIQITRLAITPMPTTAENCKSADRNDRASGNSRLSENAPQIRMKLPVIHRASLPFANLSV